MSEPDPKLPLKDPDFKTRPLDATLAIGLVVLALTLWWVVWDAS